MEVSLQKDEALPLPDQISNILRGRIRSGEYSPGKRLGSIRQFAGDFAVSPVTVIKALDILESESLIQRIPMKGIYVSRILQKEERQLNVCFAFPEKEMSPVLLQKENWALSSELHRGLLSAAAGKNAVLQFVYFEDTPSSAVLKKQISRLKEFDMVIFVGHQLEQLQRGIAGQILVVRMAGDKNEEIPDSIITVDYDRLSVFSEMAAHIHLCGCRTAAVLCLKAEENRKTVMFRNACEKLGIRTESPCIICPSVDTSLENLGETLRKAHVDFFYCMHSELVPKIYEASISCGRKIGHDFQIAGIGTGITFAGLFPQFTYFRIPRFQMGCRIMSEGIQAIRSGKSSFTLPLFHAELIQGKSTNPINHKE